ncbi:MAG: VWA-like domain-containing protein [Terriglobia bacterium]|jgi:predicted metal-dependent peptidase
MITQMTTAQKLTRARTQLLLNQPFFGTLGLRLKLVPGSLPTMATDGSRIVYNSAFVGELKPAELEGVLAHEVLHCALGHHCRRGEREPGLWNEAADLAINPLLLGNGLTLSAGALIDPAFANLSSEEIYARLLRRRSEGASAVQQQAPQQTNVGGGMGNVPQGTHGAATSDPMSDSSNGSGSSQNEQQTGQAMGPASMRSGGFGAVWDASDEHGHAASPAEKRRQEHEWSIAAEQALRSAKACGNEPGGIERPVSESRQSQQDWRAILRDFMAATAPSDYRWTPPNRRYIASGLYLPSVERRGLGEVVIAVDTSGSIGKRELEQFAAEISAISQETQPEAIHVVYCDAAVQCVQQFGSSEPVQLEPKGGGGTDFRPAFEWVAENDITSVCLIYLSDLCCNSFPETPEYPVLWVTDSRETAPFGETVRIGLE